MRKLQLIILYHDAKYIVSILQEQTSCKNTRKFILVYYCHESPIGAGGGISGTSHVTPSVLVFRLLDTIKRHTAIE